MEPSEIPTEIPLLPLIVAIRKVVDTNPSPATVTRWATKGLEGIGPDRIKLTTWSCGRKKFTTTDAVRDFLLRVTQARQEKLRQQEAVQNGVDESELRDAGLL